MNYAIILSGGVGARIGLDIPKQYYDVQGKPIIEYVFKAIEKSSLIDGFIVVAAEEWQEYIKEHLPSRLNFLGFALPGENRQLSIYNGLLVLKQTAKQDDIVLIQDAARPNTSERLFKECFTLSGDEDGAMPVLPMKDTVYYSEKGDRVDSLLKRSCIYAGQAPEVFVLEKYYQANKALAMEQMRKINGSTEPAIMAGMDIAMIPGDERNFKITTRADLERFEEVLGRKNA